MDNREEDLFFQDLIDKFQSTLDCEAASLYVLDESGTRLDLRAAAGYQKGLLRSGVHYSVGEGITGWIALKGESFLASSPEELRSHPHHAGKQDMAWESRGARSFLGIPLKQRMERL